MVHAEVEALSLGRLHIAGYSDTPLARKLGSRPDERIVAPGAPHHYRALRGDLPERATITTRAFPLVRYLCICSSGGVLNSRNVS